MLTACTMAFGVLIFGSTAATAAEDGLRFEAQTTFRLQPVVERVRVTIDVTVTHQKPDSGGYFYYFDGIFVPVPTSATNLVAVSSGGTSLSTNIEESSENWQQVLVSLPSRLLYGQQQSLQVTFDLPNLPPRSDGWIRANAAYASFPVFAVGDPGLADVTVLIPEAYDVHTTGQPMLRSRDGRLHVLTEPAIEDPSNWWAVIGAQNNDRLRRNEIEVGDTSVVIRYWPGDDEWADFVEEQITTGLPALEAVVGEPFPVTGELQIIESGTPHLYGWGGWYDSSENVIEIGDELDKVVVLHELSHAWFNGETASDLWLIEGLAETVAHRALADRDGNSEQPDKVSVDAEGAQPLLAWNSTGLATSGEPTANDDYGYAAAWWVLSTLADEIGDEQFTDVISAAVRRVMPYEADKEVLLHHGGLGWRRMLDLFEEVGGSTSAVEMYKDWVVEPADVSVIEERSAARALYAELDEGPDGWSPPLEIRRDMTEWQFGDIAEQADTADDVLAARDSTLEVLSSYGVGELPELEDAYESANDVTAVAKLGRQYIDVADTIDDATADSGIVVATFANVGLLGYDVDEALSLSASALEDGDVDEAEAHADEALDRVEDAPLVGAMRYAMFAVFLLGLSVALWGRRLSADHRLPRS